MPSRVYSSPLVARPSSLAPREAAVLFSVAFGRSEDPQQGKKTCHCVVVARHIAQILEILGWRLPREGSDS